MGNIVPLYSELTLTRVWLNTAVFSGMPDYAVSSYHIEDKVVSVCSCTVQLLPKYQVLVLSLSSATVCALKLS